MSLPTTGYTSDTASRTIKGAGVLFAGFEYDTTSSKYTYDRMLGATTGGTSLALETTLEQPQIDGLRAKAKGLDRIEEATASMTANLLESTLENLQMMILGETKKASDHDSIKDNTDYIRPVAIIGDGHYIENLALVTEISATKRLVVLFDYAIVSEGLNVEFSNEDDISFEVKFEGRTGDDLETLQSGSLPVSIFEIEV